ncbi:MAG: ABC transporter ATP-binding protein [Actinobacteria bacterium]|nr:ABC transporter ATP-binding protein [Actinomycetota bacterium]
MPDGTAVSADAIVAGDATATGSETSRGRSLVSSDAGARPLLEARSISIGFGGIQALAGVSIEVAEGEAVGIVGPNGAGKTTFFNCLCGQLRPASGSVLFAGRAIDRMPAHQRARLGIARTFQRVEIFPEMTVRDHLTVAERARAGDWRLWKDLLAMGSPRKEEREHVEQILDLVGLTELGDTPVAALSLGNCRLVELGRALALRPRLLMADEPSSGLDTHETQLLADLLRRVQQESAAAILLVEHDLDMVARVVDRVLVLDFGEPIAEGSLEEVMADPAVRSAYLGKGA